MTIFPLAGGVRRPRSAAGASTDAPPPQPAWRQPSPTIAALGVALWLAVVGNLVLWKSLGRLYAGGDLGSRPALLVLDIFLIVFATTALLLLPFAWRWTFKPVALLLLVTAGAAQHFMGAYGIMVDPSMVANALQTNYTEARDLMDWPLLGQVALVAGPPAAWLLLTRHGPSRAWTRIWQNLALAAVLVGVSAAGILGMYRDLAPLVRNHLEFRFIQNPLMPVFSAVATVTRPWRKRGLDHLVPITAGTRLGPSYAAAAGTTPQRPPLFIVVIGETARADHFGLNGYARDTTPALRRHGAIAFTDVHSCWTNTMVSVPCMFSSLGKEAWMARKAEHENLTDVLQASGLAVLWLDNQAGCKGVCARIPSASTADTFAPAETAKANLCRDGDCLDDVMLAGLDERIAALPTERRARGIVLVMHQMGSHGPAYTRRSAPENKRFMPECTNPTLASCDPQALVNVYDNSIAETDAFLGHAIDWLQARADRFSTGLLYMADHGESLGEYGLFLHGLPYSVAPEEQKRIPLVLWLDPHLAARTRTDLACLREHHAAPLTHDNFYPSVLGLLDVETPTYRSQLDAFAPCRGPAEARIQPLDRQVPPAISAGS